MNSNFQYAPGLPGYGTQGINGTDGSLGFSMFFTNLSGVDNKSDIKTRILKEQILWSSDPSIVLPNNRKYQTGDTFVDTLGRVYEINLSDSDKFIFTGTYLNTSDIFVFFDKINDIGVLRYHNQYIGTTYAVDSVFSTMVTDYTQNPDTIYGIKPVNFERIEYSDISPELRGYNPFTLYTSGVYDSNSIALVRNTVDNTFRLGNTYPDKAIRNVNFVFDVSHLSVSKNYIVNNAIASGEVLTDYEISIPNLKNPIFINAPSFTYKNDIAATDVSIYWNLQDITGTNNTASVIADLHIHQDFTPSSNKWYNFANFETDTSVMVFHNIDLSGVIGITGLTTGKTYTTYIRVYQNGWQRETSRIKIYPGITTLLDISLGSGLPQSLNATSITGATAGDTYYLDISSNVLCNITTDIPVSWLHFNHQTNISGTRANWSAPHDVNMLLDAYTDTGADSRTSVVSITGGNISKTFVITQVAPLYPGTIDLTTSWAGISGSGITGYNNFIYLYKETPDLSGTYSQWASWAPNGSPDIATKNHIFNVPYGKYKLYTKDIFVIINSVAKTRTVSYSGTITGGEGISPDFASVDFSISVGVNATIAVAFNGY